MNEFKEFIEQIIITGYLSIESEQKLRKLIQKSNYSWEEVQAFVKLQKAAIHGQVKQESLDFMPLSLRKHCPTFDLRFATLD